MTVSYTFAVETHDNTQWLCTVDVHGVVKKIAMFVSDEARKSFVATLSLAKMAAHSHGLSGI